MKKTKLLLLLAIAIFSQAPAQFSHDSSTIPVPNASSHVRWYSFFEDIPQQWEGWYGVAFTKARTNDWLLVSGLTLATYFTDDQTYTPASKLYNSSSEVRHLSDFCEEMGDGTTQFALAGAFSAYGLFFDDQRALRTGIEIGSVVISSGAVVQVLKHVTGRESPFVRTTPTGVWKILPNQIDYHRMVPHFDAFPSGHLCTSIATVVVIAENYPEIKWIRPAGYAFTSLVGLAMLNKGTHWVSDYPLGLFIGYYFGMVAAHPDGLPIAASDNTTQVNVLPYFSETASGVSFIVQF